MIRPDGTQSAKVIQVIETKSKRGMGTEKDPVREVVQYWEFEGMFLAEMDTAECKPIIDYGADGVKPSICGGTVPHP